MSYMTTTCRGCGKGFRRWIGKNHDGYCNQYCAGRTKTIIGKSKRKKIRKINNNPKGFYATQAWSVQRYEAIKRGKGYCEACGAKPTGDNPLHVDHIKPKSRYPGLALTLSNLQVLCALCNLGKGDKDETDWRRPDILPRRVIEPT